MTSVPGLGGPPRPGWYDDPQAPGRDRWWNGFQWGELTAKTPPRSMFGKDYRRSMRPAMNRDASRARLFTAIAWALLGLGFIAGIVWETVPPTRIVADIYFVSRIVIVIAGALALVYGIRGISRAQSMGGFGLSVESVVLGSVALLGGLGSIAIFLVTALAPSSR